MKRLDPKTKRPFYRGYYDESKQKYFVRYMSEKNSSGYYYEKWLGEQEYNLYRKKERLYGRKYDKTHKEKRKKYNAGYRKLNADYFKEYERKNRDKINKRRRKAYHSDPKVKYRYSKYRALKRSCCREDYSNEIAKIYALCPEGYHVDHIVPLSKGGVHAPWNLQHLSKEENLKKNNSMPDNYCLCQLMGWSLA